MNLYLDASKFVSQTSSFEKDSVDNFAQLQKALQASLETLRSDPKRVFALLKSTIRYKEILDDVIAQAGILKQEKISYGVAILLIHDLLISRTGITAGKGPLKDAVLRHKTRLRAEFTRIKIKRGIRDLSEFNVSSQDRTIRWIRINSIVPSDLPNGLPFSPTTEFPPPAGTLYADPYVPSLYALANTHTRLLLGTQAYQRGQLILQDRASCFPAHILGPRPDETVIDACAAPGNKTSHLAALMHNSGRIIAFELNADRAGVLRRMVSRAGATIVRVENRDFTGSLPKEYKKVTKLLVDPSCSGSGIFRKEQFVDKQPADNDDGHDEQFSEDPLAKRLQNLSVFQTQIMMHALTKFPNANKVVYSTCSIHAEENEDVVRNLLADREVESLGWRVVPRARAIPAWQRRGWKDRFEGLDGPQTAHEVAEACIRAEPIVDGGIGFFVVAFEKVNGGRAKRSRPVDDSGRDEPGRDEPGRDDPVLDDPVLDESENEDTEPEWAGFSDHDGAVAKKRKKRKKKKAATIHASE